MIHLKKQIVPSNSVLHCMSIRFKVEQSQANRFRRFLSIKAFQHSIQHQQISTNSSGEKRNKNKNNQKKKSLESVMFTRSYQSSYCEAGREKEYLNSSMGYNMGSYNSSNAGGCGTGCIADQQVSEYSSYSSINPGHSYGMDMGLYYNHHGGGGLACEQESFYASSSMGSGCNMPCDPSRKFMNII